MIIGPTIDWTWFNTVSNILEQGETKKNPQNIRMITFKNNILKSN